MAADRVPTRWIATIVAVVFLGVTASFGSLADAAPAPPPPVVPVDTPITTPEMTISASRASLFNTFRIGSTSPVEGSGDRVIVVQFSITNEWNEALVASPSANVGDAVRLTGHPAEPPDAILLVDDAKANPALVPGLATSVVMTWIVPGDRYHAGDTVGVEITSFRPEPFQVLLEEFNIRWESAGVVGVIDVPVTEATAPDA